MKYKGYDGSIQYSKEDGVYHGKIQNIDDLVNYESKKLKDIKEAFVKAVDDYLEFCKADGKEPNVPKGKT